MRSEARYLIKILGGGLFILFVFGYSAYQARALITGPSIELESIADGAQVAHPLLAVSGVAKNTERLMLNGRTIHTDPQGNFFEKLLVPEGYTIISLVAEDRFGRSTEKTIRLNHKESTQ